MFHISTDEVYGSIKKGEFIEHDTYNPSSPYSASKSGSDLIATAFNKTFGCKIKILCLTNNFGPYQFPEKYIPTLISSFLKNQKDNDFINQTNENWSGALPFTIVIVKKSGNVVDKKHYKDFSDLNFD